MFSYHLHPEYLISKIHIKRSEKLTECIKRTSARGLKTKIAKIFIQQDILCKTK